MLNIGCYIVFDLEYPSIYGQFLGFLQHRVVGDIELFTQNKCTNWIIFSELYMAHVQKYSIVKNIVKQFPLVPAWTCTIHKVQGLSFCKLALNIDSNIF